MSGTSSRSALRRSVGVQSSSCGIDMKASGVTGSLLDLWWRLTRRSPLVFLGIVGVISSFCRTQILLRVMASSKARQGEHECSRIRHFRPQ